MNITAKEIRAVRKVLSGKISPCLMSETYPPRTLLLVAVTILAGAGETTFKHGEYGKLLTELAMFGAKPAGGWPMDNDDPILPDEYSKKLRFGYVVASRRRKLHKSSDRGGHDIRLQLPPELQTLLDKNPGYVRRAKRLCARAEGEVEKRAEARRRDRHRSSLMFFNDFWP